MIDVTLFVVDVAFFLKTLIMLLLIYYSHKQEWSNMTEGFEDMPVIDHNVSTLRVLIMGKENRVQELLYENHFLNTRDTSLPSNIREGILNGIKTYQFYDEKLRLNQETTEQIEYITKILNHTAAQRFPALESHFAEAEPVPFVFTDYIEGSGLTACKIPEKVLELRGYPDTTKALLRNLFVVTYRFPYPPEMIQRLEFPKD